jgi:hypothetical protein
MGRMLVAMRVRDPQIRRERHRAPSPRHPWVDQGLTISVGLRVGSPARVPGAIGALLLAIPRVVFLYS